MNQLDLFAQQWQLPPGPYDVILADPPWQYGSRGPRHGQFGALDYDTLTVEEICAIPVAAIAATNAALFLWFTGSFMPEACQVVKAWGFRFIRIDKVWGKLTKNDKPAAVAGPWGLSDCEFLALGVRGQMCNQQPRPRNQYTLVEEESSLLVREQRPPRHSEKPEIFHQLIEQRFPNAQRIELFARDCHDGWDVWGNEVARQIG
ncbi:MAG: hypothetical protein F6J87_14720 [Spirulina sp. SIO3F2]|nr:hypothetical protein [Spirulina sp. SIO3F2]